MKVKLVLVKYLKSINYFTIIQFGFRPSKSTQYALINVTDMIYNSMRAGNRSTGLYIDLQTPFALVNHGRKTYPSLEHWPSYEYCNSYL